VEIPFAPDIVATSVNKGIPFVISSPSAAPTVALRAIVAAIDPVSEDSGDGAADTTSSDKKKKSRRKLSFTR
jgi:MinD-like ATPase involved in chromosome partitioning or flagellar assembly